MKSRGRLLNWLVVLGLLVFAAPLAAQNRYGGAYNDDPWLDDLVSPVALYPDDVLAILLPASMYPDDLQEADDFLRSARNDRYLRPNPDWDQSVRYLLNYPDVVYRMNDDPQWSDNLGSAFAADDRAVMEAVQRMRWRAYDDGILRSDRRQRVIIDDGRIRIVSVSAETIYIPDYDSSIFYSRPAGWSLSYYDTGYPLYYYPYPTDYRFGRPFYGGQAAWGIDWWGWDIASGIVLDWAFWHRSHRNDFYGWQHDWSHRRHDRDNEGDHDHRGDRDHRNDGQSSYWHNLGSSIATRPRSDQVQPLPHPIVRPSTLPPLPVRPVVERERRPRPDRRSMPSNPVTPATTSPPRSERPLRPQPGSRQPPFERSTDPVDRRREPGTRMQPVPRPEIGPVDRRQVGDRQVMQPRPDRPEPRLVPVPEGAVRPEPMLRAQPIERQAPEIRQQRIERPAPVVRQQRVDQTVPVVRQERVVRPAPVPAARVEQSAERERARKVRDDEEEKKRADHERQ